MEKITRIWLFLLPVAFMTSMAAMELFTWTFFLLTLVHIGRDLKTQPSGFVWERLKSPVGWAVWGYFLTVTLGALLMVSSKPLDVVGEARWILLLYAYSYVLRKYLQPEWENYLKFFCMVICLVGLVSLLQFLFGLDITRKRDILAAFGSFYRASGFFNHPLTFAYSIGMVWLVLLALALQYVKAQGWSVITRFLVMATMFSGVGLITSLSRGAWLAGASAMLIVFFQVKKKWALGALISLLLVIGALAATNSTIRDRFRTLTTVSQNESNRLRTVLWQANWQIFKSHPVIGVGLTRNKDYLLQYYQDMGMIGETIVSHAHNNYLEILAGTGTMGFLFYLGFCLYFMIKSWQLYRYLPEHQLFFKALCQGIFAAQIFLHMGGLTQCNFTDGEVTHLLVFLWGLVLAIDFLNDRSNLNRLSVSKDISSGDRGERLALLRSL